jgi:hypothetical protein
MNKEKHSISSSIIEISSKDNVTKEVTMLVHKIDLANGNGLDFKLEQTELYKDTLLNKPVVAKYYPLTNDLGHHEPVFDANGNIIGLETIAIGTIKEVWIDEFKIDDDTTVQALYAKADLWNYKYPQIVSCVEKLFNEGNADSSVEVEIYSYGANPSQEYRYATDYCYIGNCLLGSTILPADSDAGVISVAQKEIASAVQFDLNSLAKKGDETMPTTETTEVFNKGFEVRFHGATETAALKFSEIRNQIYNLLNPIDPKNGYRDYNYYLRDLYNEYVIAEDWNHDEQLYKIPYTITNDQVTLAPKDDWQKGVLGFIPEGVEINSLISEKEIELNELNNKLTQVKEDLANMAETKTVEVQELEIKIVELNSKIEELNNLIVQEKEAKTTLEGTITELNSTIDTLTPFKEQVESAEKQAKVTEVSSKYSKLLSKETFDLAETQTLINELKVTELNELVVSEIAKVKVVEVASTKTDENVTIVASKQEDLIQKSILQKYGIEG